MAKKSEKVLGDVSEIYLSKWKDASGQLYYMDQPRPGEYILRRYTPPAEPDPEPAAEE